MIPCKIAVQAMNDQTLLTFVYGGGSVGLDFLYEMVRREMHRRLNERGFVKWQRREK